MKQVLRRLRSAARRIGKRGRQDPATIPGGDEANEELDRERIMICHQQYAVLRRIQEIDFPRDADMNWQREKWDVDRANQLTYLLYDIEQERINNTHEPLALLAGDDESEQPMDKTPEQPESQAADPQADKPVEGHVVFDNPFLKDKVEEEDPDAPPKKKQRRKLKLSPSVKQFLNHPIDEIGRRLGGG